MMSAAPWTFVDHLSNHCNNALRTCWALFPAFELALHLKKNIRMFAEEKMTVNYTHEPIGFVSSAFLGYSHAIRSGRGSKQGERTMTPPSDTGKKTRRESFARSRNRTPRSES